MLIQTGQPSARRRSICCSPVKSTPGISRCKSDLGPDRRSRGIRLIPLEGLIRMKLTSFRLKDQAHLKDLEEAGLLPAEMEAGLSETLRNRFGANPAHE